MSWLLSVFIAATVFGVGVTTIDLLGLIGDHEDGADDSGEGDADADGADTGDWGDADADGAGDWGDTDADVSGDTDGMGDTDGDGAIGADTDGFADGSADDSGDTGHHGEADSSVAGHDQRNRRNPVLRILSFMRNIVYFALGFGPTGWFALGTGESLPAALAWAGGVGTVVLVGARILRRVLRTELNSEITSSDLLMEKAQVTVTVSPNQLGRVRVSIGGRYVDRYARSRLDRDLSPGTHVRVVDLGEDCVFVEPEGE